MNSEDCARTLQSRPTQFWDILFVNPAHHGPDYYSPIGVNMLATIVEQAGYAVGLLDFQRKVIGEGFAWPEGFLAAAETVLAHHRAKVFGFTVMNVGLPWALELAAITKRLHPDATIVFGGPHATLLGREILELYPQVDIVARNEGETAILPLTHALVNRDREALETCPNLLLRRENGDVHATGAAPMLADLDVLPLMTLDAELLASVGILSVEAGRGCPYHCSFCSSHAIWTRAPRFKSPKRLVDEAMTYLRNAPPRDEQLVISYEHDDFLSNRPLFRRFVEYKLQSNADFLYGITTRINHLSEEVVALLAKSGCVSVFMGLETGSERLQKSSSKHLKLDQIAPAIRRLKEARMHVSTNFIVGFPDETYDDIAASFELMLSLAWLGCSINISMMCPEPGSMIHAQTPPEDYRLLPDGLYARELRLGGIEPEKLDVIAKYHLLTINNADYDILEMAAVSQSMQFLMSEFPFLLHEIYRDVDFEVRALLARVRDFSRERGAICYENYEAFAATSLTPRGRSTEFIAYEAAKYAVKHDEALRASPGDFSSDMPGAYYEGLDRITGLQWRSLERSWAS